MADVIFKVCSKCGRSLPLDCFNQEMKRGKLILRAECKECKSLAHAAWQAKKRKHYNRYMRKYGKQWRAKHPGGEQAKRGRLRRTLSKEGNNGTSNTA